MTTTDRKTWIRRWGEEHPEQGVELAFRQIGDDNPPNRIWELGVWLDWTRFGIGFDMEREYGSPSWPDRLHICVNLGPISLTAVRTWNERLMPDRWEKASFQDSTEAAIHHALIKFKLECEERDLGRDGRTWPDLSDIYIQTRRLIRSLVDGSKDPDEYLDEWDR